MNGKRRYRYDWASGIWYSIIDYDADAPQWPHYKGVSILVVAYYRGIRYVVSKGWTYWQSEIDLYKDSGSLARYGCRKVLNLAFSMVQASYQRKSAGTGSLKRQYRLYG